MADTLVWDDGYEVGVAESGEGTTTSDVWDQEACELRVLKKKCGTCIFGANRFVSAGTVRAMEQETRDGGESSHIQCHHTLPSVSGREDVGAVCRGWWDRNAMRSWVFRLAKRNGVVKYVEEPAVADGMSFEGAWTGNEQES